MKRLIAILSVLAALLLFIPQGASAYTNVSLSVGFHDSLAPYGTWVNFSSYGQVWRPAAAGFVPYTNGHWVYTSYGPTWVGYEPYEWAVFHYGQWVYSPEFGWVWNPGYTYSPGNVVWATGPGYVGWAPNYPGFSSSNFSAFVFVDSNHFNYPNYAHVLIRGERVRPLFDRRVVQIQRTALLRQDMERIVRRPIQVVKVQEREVEVDHHHTRLVVPAGHETVLKEVSKAAAVTKSHEVEKEKKTPVKSESKNTVQNRSHEQMTHNQPAIHTSNTAHGSFQHSVAKKSPQPTVVKQESHGKVTYTNKHTPSVTPVVRNTEHRNTHVSTTPVSRSTEHTSSHVTNKSVEKHSTQVEQHKPQQQMTSNNKHEKNQSDKKKPPQ